MFFKKKDKKYPSGKNRFYDLLTLHSTKLVEGLEALVVFANRDKVSKEGDNPVKSFEKEADELRRVLIEELENTFVTPIDREDIFALSRAIDDILDYANTTIDEMAIYEVKADEHIKEMVTILKNAAVEINDSIKMLREYPKIASEHAVKAKYHENSMERAYHKALASLFKGKDTVYMMKMREIYRHLSNAADRGDEVANIISNIVMKHHF